VKVAYVDTSCLVAIAFGERGASAVARRLTEFDEIVSANLLEAELRAAVLRERLDWGAALVAGLSWVAPDRPLHAEIARVLAAGHVRGADCWHLATALYVASDPATIAFVTLDARQGVIARTLGFRE